MNPLSRPTTRWLLAASAIAFGLLTIASGGRALFGSAEAQAAVGDAVPFVLWFNFVAGFGYVLAGVGVGWDRRWGLWAALALVLATAVVTMAFAAHVLGGGRYEVRTAAALGLRLGFWVVVYAVGRKVLPGAAMGSGQQVR